VEDTTEVWKTNEFHQEEILTTANLHLLAIETNTHANATEACPQKEDTIEVIVHHPQIVYLPPF
jgi:hypothetical protein